MSKKLTYHFYLKNKNSTKPTPINFAVNAGGYRKKMGIGESILPRWWNEESESAIESNLQKKAERALAKRVNKNLNKLRSELDTLFEEYNAIDKLTPNHTEGEDYVQTLFEKASSIITGAIEDEAKDEEAARKTPTQFFNEFIEQWSHSPNRRTGIVPKKETIWNYKNTVRRYTDYIEDSGEKDSFAIFNEDFQAKFDDYLMNEQELAMNTIVGSHSQLKTMLKRAYEKGLLRDPAFLHWTSKTINFTHVYLNDEELNRIFNLQLTDEVREENKIGQESHIEESRDLFIISARTGLRYSDLRNLSTATWNLKDGKETITILVQKTSDRLVIPLHHQVIALYHKYDGALPKPVDKSKYNEHIRLCAKLANINQVIQLFQWEKGRPVLNTKLKFELVSSHTGRRSFATNLYLVCKKPHQVMALTGHKTEESFKHYICVNQAEMAEVVRKYINLDKNVEFEDDETYQKFISTVREDTRTIDNQQKEISLLEDRVKNMKFFAEVEKKELEDTIASQRFALGIGLTLDQYEEAKRQSDIIAGAVDDNENYL